MESQLLTALKWEEMTANFLQQIEARKGTQPQALFDDLDQVGARMLEVALKLKNQPNIAEPLWVLGAVIASQDVDGLIQFGALAHDLLHSIHDYLRDDGVSTRHPSLSRAQIKERLAQGSALNPQPPIPKKETLH